MHGKEIVHSFCRKFSEQTPNQSHAQESKDIFTLDPNIQVHAQHFGLLIIWAGLTVTGFAFTLINSFRTLGLLHNTIRYFCACMFMYLLFLKSLSTVLFGWMALHCSAIPANIKLFSYRRCVFFAMRSAQALAPQRWVNYSAPLYESLVLYISNDSSRFLRGFAKVETGSNLTSLANHLTGMWPQMWSANFILGLK